MKPNRRLETGVVLFMDTESEIIPTSGWVKLGRADETNKQAIARGDDRPRREDGDENEEFPPGLQPTDSIIHEHRRTICLLYLAEAFAADAVATYRGNAPRLRHITLAACFAGYQDAEILQFPENDPLGLRGNTINDNTAQVHNSRYVGLRFGFSATDAVPGHVYRRWQAVELLRRHRLFNNGQMHGGRT
ncbi:MAG: hypothetical protein ABI876_04460 [Bacteroidota bacterium]